MAIITSILSYLLSLWPIFGVTIIISLSTILLLKKRNKKQDAWSEGIPEIKPGLIWGNDILAEDGCVVGGKFASCLLQPGKKPDFATSICEAKALPVVLG